MADSHSEIFRSYADAFAHCIGCRACESACPSGVPFHLLEHGSRLSGADSRTVGGPTGLVLRHLDSPFLLRALARAGQGARVVLRGLLGARWRPKLEDAGGWRARWGGLLGTMPVSPGDDQALCGLLDDLLGEKSVPREPPIPCPKAGMRELILFRGCANEGLLPESTRRLEALLRAAGCRISSARGQECCGALAAHTGRPGRAATLRRHNRQALTPLLTRGRPLVVEAAGCGHHLQKDEGGGFAEAVDAAVLLDDLDLPPLRALELTVVYHDPCHARHGQGIGTEPRRLLARIPGLTLREPHEAEMCCGSGGAWGPEHPELSRRLARRKARNLAATGADLVVTANPGCLGQIADGLALEVPRLPILPLTDLLWYAAFTCSA
ncbi:hypothetical protein CSA17_02855 [bacterium DOLJORAL78_65_58]|nr:MAG: hypothetical protein CSA17_02855 [bacterium DOLJORAL78_65_58]